MVAAVLLGIEAQRDASPSTGHLRPRPTYSEAPTPTADPATSVRVTSISGLLNALADNTLTDIVVANGTYRVSPASSQASNSLWIGARFAGRTTPITVRAETRGGVTFDGGGTTGFGCISFEAGAHDQTWDGFRCANGQATRAEVRRFLATTNIPRRQSLFGFAVRFTRNGDLRAPATFGIYRIAANGSSPLST